MSSRLNRLFIAGMTAAILAATLWPLPEFARDEPAAPWVQWSPYAADLVRNMLLFGPLGALLLRWTTSRVIAATATLSVLIEIAQLVLPGRVPSPWDVVANVAGATLAHAIARIVDRRGLGNTRLHRQAYVIWSGVVVAALLIASLGFRTAPPSGPWYAHWTPDLGHLETYQGNLTAASLNGAPIAHGLIRLPDVERQLRSDHLLEVRGTRGAAPGELSALFLVTNYSGDEVLMLGLRDEDGMYRVASLGMRFGLENPFSWWRGALPPDEGGSAFSASAYRSGNTTCVTIDRQARCDLAPGIEDGWQHWLPAEHLDPRTCDVLDVAWLAILFVPLGAGLRARPLELVCLAGALIALAAAPAIGPLASLGLAPAITVGASLVGGRILAALAYRFGRRAAPSPPHS
jgi:hypothetical protein